MIDNTIISISIILLASFVFILSMKGKLFGGYNKKSILNDLNSSGLKFPKKFRVISCEDISKVWREPSEKTTIEFYSNFLDMIKWIKNLFRKKTMSKESIQLPTLPESDILEVRDFALNGWELGETHGLSHWQRVERNGILLSVENGKLREDINIKVVRFFAYLHDKCRLNDLADLEHGVRAADMIPTIKDTILKDFTDEEVALLEKACKYHTTEHRTGNPTIDVCFDADRLDLGRVGIVSNPKLMATGQGAYYAANIHLIEELNKEIQ